MKTKHLVLGVVALFFLIGVAGCASHTAQSKPAEAQPAAAKPAPAPAVPLPKTSIFNKIQVGMAKAEVHQKIGAPTDYKVVMSGKAWIPFYYRGDTTRTVEYYKKEGRLLYSNGNDRLIEIIYDPNEDGYKD
jgi:hypothetical protein